MGGEVSQACRDGCKLYEGALKSTCVLPDVGIDESLMEYSGLNSSAVLQAYSNELLNSVPGYVEKLGTAMGGLTSVPNAVGFVALVISMIMEIAVKSSQQAGPDTYILLRRVFGEEKASAVRDTMSLSVTRCHTYINDDQRLLEELRRLEAQLSDHLNSLKNSLLYDGQMSTRGFKIWVNGASFHLQMRIHEARLNVQAGKHESDDVDSIKRTTNGYLQDLEHLLEKYKTYKISTSALRQWYSCILVRGGSCKYGACYIKDTENTNCGPGDDPHSSLLHCHGCEWVEPYINHVFSNYKPITSLKTHFSTVKDNINFLISQHDGFTLPSTI